jgi:hypothetical protein
LRISNNVIEFRVIGAVALRDLTGRISPEPFNVRYLNVPVGCTGTRGDIILYSCVVEEKFSK